MLIACWSVKGGVGTTVVAAGFAATLAVQRSVLLVDLTGDAAVALGARVPDGPGLADWLALGDDVPPDALARLEVPLSRSLSLLPPGGGPSTGPRARLLPSLLSRSGRVVVVDCGQLPAQPGVGRELAAAADRSLLVIRNCFLAARRCDTLPVPPTGLVVVREPNRALDSADLARIVQVPVVAELALDPAVARAVDAGLLLSRRPRRFAAALEAAA